jgi:EAL domain-containing protein (putative c-di-GMP-specific phosphodiesterase class I)
MVFRAGRNNISSFHATVQDNSADRALALIQFDKLLTDRAVAPHFQPIITMDERQVVGYEILGRSRLFGLTDPKSMFQAAAVLNMEAELSRIFRDEGVKQGANLPGHCLLFANTHPNEIDADYLKFDMKLVQNLSQASLERQKMVERLVQMTLELGIIALAEGVEHEADHIICRQMGFACGQGFLYGRPATAASALR